MRHAILSVLLLTALAFITGCGGGGGGGGGSTSSITVSVYPTSTYLMGGGNRTFMATVTGTTNTAVTWSVQEGSAGGSITSGGVYTAPSTPGFYHVVARSVADTSKSATAVVEVLEAPPPIE